MRHLLDQVRPVAIECRGDDGDDVAWSPVAASGMKRVLSTVAFTLRRALQLPDPEMLFLLAIMITAAAFGRGPSLLASALSVAAYDFFFVPPTFTFSVSDTRYILTFAMMFGLPIAQLRSHLAIVGFHPGARLMSGRAQRVETGHARPCAVFQ